MLLDINEMTLLRAYSFDSATSAQTASHRHVVRCCTAIVRISYRLDPAAAGDRLSVELAVFQRRRAYGRRVALAPDAPGRRRLASSPTCGLDHISGHSPQLGRCNSVGSERNQRTAGNRHGRAGRADHSWRLRRTDGAGCVDRVAPRVSSWL